MKLSLLVMALLAAACATAPVPVPEAGRHRAAPPDEPPLQIIVTPKEAPALAPSLPVLGRGAFPAEPPEPALLDRSTTMSVHVLDVGQGSATLLELPCGAVLVDTGGEDNGDFDSVDALLSQLDAFFARRKDLGRTIDLLVITHPHIDHVRGIPAVLSRFKVKNIVDGGQDGASNVRSEMRTLHEAVRAGVRYRAVHRNDVPDTGLTDDVIDPISCPAVDPVIRVLSGSVSADPGWRDSKSYANANNHSVVTRVDFGASSLLITGDLEEPAIDDLVQKFSSGPSKLLDVDVYLAGHHGSANGTTAGLLRAMSPQVAVVSMGAEWRHQMWTAWAYGHPRKTIVSMLHDGVSGSRAPRHVLLGVGVRRFVDAEMDKAVFATGWDGPVVIDMSAHGEVVPRPPLQ